MQYSIYDVSRDESFPGCRPLKLPATFSREWLTGQGRKAGNSRLIIYILKLKLKQLSLKERQRRRWMRPMAEASESVWGKLFQGFA